MKNISIIILLASLGILLSGCGNSMKEIDIKSHGTRSDVFVEVKGDELIPTGYADLMIKVSIKTPLEGYYILASK